jgi:signal transduction histidine kinase
MVFAAALFIATLGLLVMIGWGTGNRSLVQFHPSFVQMQFNAALCFFLMGTALALWSPRQHRTAAIFAAPVLIIATLTLVEYAFSIGLGLDELFVRDTIGLKLDHPGRMPLQAAISFLFSSLPLLYSIRFPDNKNAPYCVSAAGLAVMAQGLLVTGSYLLGHKTYFLFGTGMAFHACLGFVALGFGIAFNNARKNYWRCLLQARCLPMFVAVVPLVLVLNIWQALEAAETEAVNKTTDSRLKDVRQHIEAIIGSEMVALQRMKSRWGARRPERDEWESDARMYMSHYVCMQSFTWVDSSLRPQWRVDRRVSMAPESAAAPSGALVTAMTRAREGRTDILGLTGLSDSEHPTYFAVLPLSRQSVDDGILLVDFDARTCFNEILALLPVDLPKTYGVSIFDGGRLIYTNQAEVPIRDLHWGRETTVPLNGMNLTIRLWPLPAFVESRHTALSGVVLSSGIMMACLLAALTWMTQKIRSRAERIEEAYVQVRVQSAERKKAERALLQTEKLAALGRMSAGVAHELNQPLHIIKSHCQGISLNIKDGIPMTDEDVLTHLADADLQIDRMDEILRGMKSFGAHGHDTDLNPLDVNALINFPLNVLQKTRLEERGVALRLRPFARPLFIMGNERSLQRVVSNLILNAIDAIDGTPGAARPGENSIEARVVPSPDEIMVVIEVEDTGDGIRGEDMDKIFEPFFTTKGPDKGTGLGLFICRDIIAHHGGEITATSTPGKGTTFRVKLPRIPDPDPGFGRDDGGGI